MTTPQESPQFSPGFRKLQMYAEFLMGGLASVMFLLYLDGKYTHILTPEMLVWSMRVVFFPLLLCSMFAGAKAVVRIGLSLTSLKEIGREFIDFHNKRDKDGPL